MIFRSVCLRRGGLEGLKGFVEGIMHKRALIFLLERMALKKILDLRSHLLLIKMILFKFILLEVEDMVKNI
jgi:hypothetical protein